MSKGSDIVTDHAVVRYLERVYGVDLARLRSRIAKVTAHGRNQGATAVQCSGVKYLISKSGKVVTVTGNNQPLTNRGKRWKARRK